MKLIRAELTNLEEGMKVVTDSGHTFIFIRVLGISGNRETQLLVMDNKDRVYRLVWLHRLNGIVV